jgi:hypothetical protein
LVFGVCANSKKPIRRNAIRKSWARDALTFFVVAGDWEEISKEFEREGDLLWIDAPEDYRNGLTPKTLGFIHFGATQLDQRYHLGFDFIFKTDDDVYVNATEMSVELKGFEKVQQQPVQYYGGAIERSSPFRNKTTTGDAKKWYLSWEDYPDTYFPPYAPGVGYALSKDFSRCAADNIKNMIQMPWEDVATGMLAAKCKAPLTSAHDHWAHLWETFNYTMHSAMAVFPYKDYKDGGKLVKILHKVKPWFFLPLYKQESLLEARQYVGKKREETKEKRTAWADEHVIKNKKKKGNK